MSKTHPCYFKFYIYIFNYIPDRMGVFDIFDIVFGVNKLLPYVKNLFVPIKNKPHGLNGCGCWNRTSHENLMRVPN